MSSKILAAVSASQRARELTNTVRRPVLCSKLPVEFDVNNIDHLKAARRVLIEGKPWGGISFFTDGTLSMPATIMNKIINTYLEEKLGTAPD
jgi:hypothetical protein